MARQLRKRAKNDSAATAARVDCTALYLRVSTDQQANEGYSLEAQREKLTAYCTAHGWNLCPQHIYVDAGISGTSTDDRAALAAMLEAATAGEITRIVAVKLDRIARNVRDFLGISEQLNEVGCDLALIAENFDTSTPTGKFALTMLAAVAELEASTITERVMSGKRQKAREGKFNGAPAPLGFDYNGDAFSPNADAGTIRRIFHQFVEGASLSAIASEMNQGGATTARGGQWHASTVKYILTNGIYAGLAQWDGHEAETLTISPIISRELYDAAHARLVALKPGPRR